MNIFPKQTKKCVGISVSITPDMLTALTDEIRGKIIQAEERGELPTIIFIDIPPIKIFGLPVIPTEP